MSHDCDVIDLTFDDEETGNNSQERALRDIPNSFTNLIQRIPKRSQLVNNCLSNSNTFGVLQSYRSNNAPFQIPTIVKIQSLATASSSGVKQRRDSKSLPSSSKVITKKNSVNLSKKSVFNKQKITPIISSAESIAESIESCIQKHLCCGDSMILPDPGNANLNNKLIPLDVSLKDIDEHIHESDIEEIEPAGAIIPKSPADVEKSQEGMKSFAEVSSNTMLFRQFVSKVMSLEENENDKQRASEKILNHHEKATKEYKESINFADVIKCQLEKVDKENLYMCLKDVLDALKQNKASKRAVLAPIAGPSSRQEVNDTTEKSDEPELLDPSKKKEVDRLYICLNKLNAKIKKLEETEVDLSDEEDSAFCKMQRYRDRFAKVHKKLCEYYGTSYHAGRCTKKKIRFNSTKYPEVNKVIERWLNRKGSFPDFADVMNILKTLNLNLKPDHLHYLAEEVFREIGRKLQRRRELDFWDSLSAYDPCSEDPALSDSRLNAILEQNRKTYKEKETELINSFVEKQLNGEDSDKSSESMEDDEVSQGTVSADLETTENEDDNASMLENTIHLPSPSRSPLTKMINEAVTEGLSSLKRKRSTSTDSSVSTKKNSASVRIEAESASFHKSFREDRKNNPRPALSSKPFGSVGQIIELNHVTVPIPNPILMKSIFNDSTNTIHNRSKSLGPAIKRKEINEVFLRQKKLNRFKSFSRSDSCLTNTKYVLKSHGADDDTSTKGNRSNTESNDSTNRNVTGSMENNNGSASSSGDSGDGDKDKNKKTIDNLEAEAHDDNKDEDDDDDLDEDESLGCMDAKIEMCVTEKEDPEVNSSEDASATLQSCTSYVDSGLNSIECEIGTATSRNAAALNRVDCEIEDNCSENVEATSSGRVDGNSDLGSTENPSIEDMNNEVNNGSESESESTSDFRHSLDSGVGYLRQSNTMISAAENDVQSVELDSSEDAYSSLSTVLVCKTVIDDGINSSDDPCAALRISVGDENIIEKSEICNAEVDSNDTTVISQSEIDQECNSNNIVMETCEDPAVTPQNSDHASKSGTSEECGSSSPSQVTSSSNIENETDKCGDLVETSLVSDEIALEDLNKLKSNEHATDLGGVDRENNNSVEEESSSAKADYVKSTKSDSRSKVDFGGKLKPQQQSSDENSENQNNDSKENNESDESIGENEKQLSESSSSKIYRKPAWIDNGEESENESNDSFMQSENGTDKTPDMTDKIVTSTRRQMKDGENSTKQPSRNILKKRPNEVQKLVSETPVTKPKLQAKKRCSDTLVKESDLKKRRQQEKERNLRELEKTKQKIAMSGTVLKKISSNVVDDVNDIEVISENIVSKPVTEEDRVKRFLETAQNNTSITVTRKKSLSTDAMRALNQLKKLKNISATRVAQSARNEQAGPSKVLPLSRKSLPTPIKSKSSLQTRSPSNSRLSFPNLSSSSRVFLSSGRGRQTNNGLPVISSVQSYNRRTPMITSVKGNSGTTMRKNTVTPTRMQTSASRARGRGATRGSTRIVPVVVLD